MLYFPDNNNNNKKKQSQLICNVLPSHVLGTAWSPHGCYFSPLRVGSSTVRLPPLQKLEFLFTRAKGFLDRIYCWLNLSCL
eukprot:gene2586-1605_t